METAISKVLLVLIGVERLETLKAYVKKDVIHVRVVLEVALIAMARKVIIEEPNTLPSLTLEWFSRFKRGEE